MVTDVIKKIGTDGGPSRDYSTLQTWENAIPADLRNGTGTNEQWIGEVYDDGLLSTSGINLDVNGHQTNTTHRIILRPAAGEGFADKATRIDYMGTGFGASCRNTGTYIDGTIRVNDSWVNIEGMQVQYSASSGGFVARCTNNDVFFKECVLETLANQTGRVIGSDANSRIHYWNCLINTDDSATITSSQIDNVGSFINNTVVKPSGRTGSGTGCDVGFRECDIINCVVANISNAFKTDAGYTGNYNAMEQSGTDLPGSSGPGGGMVPADMWVSQSNNFKIKAGSALIKAGNRQSEALTDIFGTPRAAGLDASVGCHEFIAPPTAFPPWKPSIQHLIGR